MSGDRRSRWRHVHAATMVLALALTFLVAVPQPSYAASCSGSGCTGQDPQSAGCSSGAYNLRQYYWGHNGGPDTHYGHELRWSPNCSAFWGRFVRHDCRTLNNHGFWLKVHRDVQTPYGWSPAASYYKDIPSAWYSGFNCDSIRWTKMIGWQVGSRYKTCRYRYYESRPDPAALPDSAWECLDWFVVPAP
jgi:hypothetical protein